MGDLGLAVRSLLKSKLFTAVAVTTLAIGIGITTAVFTIYSAVVLRPLPFPEQHRLVDIEEWSASELCAGCAVGVSRPTFNDLKSRFSSVQSLAAYTEVPMNVGAADAPERVSAALVSGNFFGVLGLKPLLGRGIDANDDRVGAPPVVVLSEQLFTRRFGGDRALVGQQIRLNGTPTTVVGVMPSSAVLPEFAKLWTALEPSYQVTDRGTRDLAAIGRLKAGATFEQADAEMKTIASGIAKEHPDTQHGWTGRARSLRTALADNEKDVYGLMLGAVIVLWLIVCANLAGLLLTRGLGRRREVAVRLALGARRRTVVWHLLSESICLAIAGGVLGLIAASWTTDLLLASLDTQIPAWIKATMDWRVMTFSVAISLLSVAAFGLVPALRASRSTVHDELKAGSAAQTGGGKSALRGSLVVVQLSLSLVLLAAAGVLSAAVSRISARQGANDDRDVLQTRVELLGTRTPDEIAVTVTNLVGRLSTMPGAQAVGATGSRFIAGFGGRDVGIRAEGVADVPPGVSPRFFFAVTPQYFETMRMSLREGRGFTPADRRGAEPVVIINRRQAQRLWPGRPAIGKRIKLGTADSLPWRTIVGIVSDVGDSTRASSEAYVPFAQVPQSIATILVRGTGDPSSLMKSMREIARAADRDLPLLDLMTVEQAHARQYWPYRAFALTMSAFGIVALILAGIGLYGVVAYAAEQRTREIGVRIALGAKGSDVIGLITRQGFRLVTIGVLFGIVGATLVLPLMKGMFWIANPFDVVVFSGAALLLIAVSLFASYLPARRATRVDPTIALRSE